MFALLEIELLLDYLFDLLAKSVVFIGSCGILFFYFHNITILIFDFWVLCRLRLGGTITA